MVSLKRLQTITAVANSRQQGIVVLEDIYDPHNAAAVFRTCDAFGIQKVCLIFDKGQRFNPKKLGKVTSASANKWLDFEIFSSARQCFSKLKRQGYSIVATVLDAKAKNIFKTKFKNPKTALVFGNEHTGLSPAAIELSDAHLYIPMRGFVQSLNLSVSAALCLYEMSRQQNPSSKFLLPRSQQNKLIRKWKGK